MDPTKGDVFLDPGLIRGAQRPDRREGPEPSVSAGSGRGVRIAAAILVLALVAALLYAVSFG